MESQRQVPCRESEKPRKVSSLGAGLSPAEGSVKPTAGFTFDDVIYPSPAPPS